MSVNRLFLLLVIFTYLIVACTSEGAVSHTGRYIKNKASCIDDVLTVPEVLSNIQRKFWWHVDTDEEFQATMSELLKPHIVYLFNQVTQSGPGKKVIAMLESTNLLETEDISNTIKKVQRLLPEQIDESPSAWKFFAPIARYVYAPDISTVRMFQKYELFKDILARKRKFLRYLDMMIASQNFKRLKKVLVSMFIDVDALVNSIKMYLDAGSETNTDIAVSNEEDNEEGKLRVDYGSVRRGPKLQRTCENEGLGEEGLINNIRGIFWKHVIHDNAFASFLSRLFNRKVFTTLDQIMHMETAREVMSILEQVKVLDFKKFKADMNKARDLLQRNLKGPVSPWKFIGDIWRYVFPESAISRSMNYRSGLIGRSAKNHKGFVLRLRPRGIIRDIFDKLVGVKPLVRSVKKFVQRLPGYKFIKGLLRKLGVDLDGAIEVAVKAVYNRIIKPTKKRKFIFGRVSVHNFIH